MFTFAGTAATGPRPLTYRAGRLGMAASDIIETRCKLTDIDSSRYSITERRVPEPIPVFGSQSAGDVNQKPSGGLPLLSDRPAVTPATLKRAATNFAAW